MRIVTCSYDRHVAAIQDIFNEAIMNSTALYEYQPRSLSMMEDWFRTKEAGGFPVIGVESAQGQLLGFASYGIFRAYPAYKYTVEHSVYVQRDHRGQGLGLMLMRELIVLARAQERHLMVGAVDAANVASIALHRKLGFAHAGTIAQAGFKFGRWLDLAFYQLLLDTPASPVDG